MSARGDERVIELETYEYFAVHAKAEVDRLVDLAAKQIERLEQAVGSCQEIGIKHLVERELAGIRRQLTRAQLSLVHASDRRYAASQRLLEATDGNGYRTPMPALAKEHAAA